MGIDVISAANEGTLFDSLGETRPTVLMSHYLTKHLVPLR